MCVCIYLIVCLHTEIIFKTIILFPRLEPTNHSPYILCGGTTKMPRVLHRVIFIYLFKLNFVKEQKLKSQIGKNNLHVSSLFPFLEINLSSVFRFAYFFF